MFRAVGRAHASNAAACALTFPKRAVLLDEFRGESRGGGGVRGGFGLESARRRLRGFQRRRASHRVVRPLGNHDAREARASKRGRDRISLGMPSHLLRASFHLGVRDGILRLFLRPSRPPRRAAASSASSARRRRLRRLGRPVAALVAFAARALALQRRARPFQAFVRGGALRVSRLFANFAAFSRQRRLERRDARRG